MSGYKRGDVLIQSHPFAFIIIMPYRGVVCEHCWGRMSPATHQVKCEPDNDSQQNLSLQVCPNCGLVCYCSSRCRLAGTAEHRLECLIMTRAGASARHRISDHLRLIVRIWLKIRSEGVHRVERAENLSKCWDYLVDHSKELQVKLSVVTISEENILFEAEGDNREVLKTEFNELGTILSKADMPSLETFINIYSKILVNSFSLRSDRTSTPEHFGTGIYLVASLLNHSCSPNCTVVFQGRKLSIVATKDIKPGVIPEVAYITYVNSLDDTETRRDQLSKTWHFKCDCNLCQNTKLDGEKHSAVCGHCAGGFRPISPSSWTSPRPCPLCGHQDKEQDARLLAKYKEIYLRLTVKSDVDFDTMCENTVEEMDGVFSNSDILYIKAAHHVFTVAITTGEIALAGYIKYYGGSAGLVAAVLRKSDLVELRTDQHDTASQCLHEADRIYRVIPGAATSFYRHEFRPVFNKIVQ